MTPGNRDEDKERQGQKESQYKGMSFGWPSFNIKRKLESSVLSCGTKGYISNCFLEQSNTEKDIFPVISILAEISKARKIGVKLYPCPLCIVRC